MTARLFCTLYLVACAAVSSAMAADKAAVRGAPIAASELAPDFTLEDQDGVRRTLSAERGKPVVLVFYRGHW